MEPSEKGVIEFFVNLVLSKEENPENEDPTLLEQRRSIARSILKQPQAQNVIIDTIVRLSPIVETALIKAKKTVSKKTESNIELTFDLPPLKKDDELTHGHISLEEATQLFRNYEQIESWIGSVKKVFTEYNHESLENPVSITEADILEGIEGAQREVHSSGKLVELLREMQNKEPAFFMDILDISHESWAKHKAFEQSLKEEKKEFFYKYSSLVTEYLNRENWIKEKSGLKIEKLEQKLEEQKELGRLTYDRLNNMFEDLVSRAYEDHMREEEVLQKATMDEPVPDFVSAQKKINNLNTARGILEKKLAFAEKNNKGLEFKLESTNKHLNEEIKNAAIWKNSSEKLEELSYILTDNTYFIEEHRNKIKKMLEKEKYLSLEERLAEGKYELTKAENAVRKVGEVKKKFLDMIPTVHNFEFQSVMNNFYHSLNLDDPNYTVEEIKTEVEKVLLSPNNLERLGASRRSPKKYNRSRSSSRKITPVPSREPSHLELLPPLPIRTEEELSNQGNEIFLSLVDTEKYEEKPEKKMDLRIKTVSKIFIRATRNSEISAKSKETRNSNPPIRKETTKEQVEPPVREFSKETPKAPVKEEISPEITKKETNFNEKQRRQSVRAEMQPRPDRRKTLTKKETTKLNSFEKVEEKKEEVPLKKEIRSNQKKKTLNVLTETTTDTTPSFIEEETRTQTRRKTIIKKETQKEEEKSSAKPERKNKIEKTKAEKEETEIEEIEHEIRDPDELETPKEERKPVRKALTQIVRTTRKKVTIKQKEETSSGSPTDAPSTITPRTQDLKEIEPSQTIPEQSKKEHLFEPPANLPPSPPEKHIEVNNFSESSDSLSKELSSESEEKEETVELESIEVTESENASETEEEPVKEIILKEAFIPMEEIIIPEIPQDQQAFHVILYRILASNKKVKNLHLSEIPKLKVVLSIKLGEKNVEEMIIEAVHKSTAKKSNNFTETDVEGQLVDFSKAYSPMIKSLIARLNEQNSEIKSARPSILRKFAEGNKKTRFSIIEANPIKLWFSHEFQESVAASSKFFAEFDIETERRGLKVLDEEKNEVIWEDIIDRRLKEGEPDPISLYLRGFIGTENFSIEKEKIIKTLEQNDMEKMTEILTGFPVDLSKTEQDRAREKKGIKFAIVEKWSYIIKKQREKAARSLGRSLVFEETDIHDLWYQISVSIKFVKHRLSKMSGRDLVQRSRGRKNEVDEQLKGLYIREKWLLKSSSPPSISRQKRSPKKISKLSTVISPRTPHTRNLSLVTPKQKRLFSNREQYSSYQPKTINLPDL